MREILFRGKQVDNGEWVYGNHLFDDVSGKHYIIPFGNITESEKVGQDGCCYCVGFEVIPETVGQYTGLTDKNGTKIFEGDIVRLKRFGNIECGKIVFNTNTAGFEFWHEVTVGAYGKKSTRKENLCAFAVSVVEIIGNIHDNPELLGGDVNA